MTCEVTTRVAQAGWSDHLFQGYRVFEELAGGTNFWSLLSVATGFDPLADDAAILLDDICVCTTVADPRIWPMKMTQLIGSYGNPLLGLLAALVGIDHAQVGPSSVGSAARLFVELRAAARSVPLGEVLGEYVGRGLKLPGFGVPFRKEDERVIALAACLEKRGWAELPHWQLVLGIDRWLMEHKSLRINIIGAIAAAGLDAGLTPEQLERFSMFFGFHCLVANSWEAAETQAAVLRKLPDEALEYVGPPPRQTPRAAAVTER